MSAYSPEEDSGRRSPFSFSEVRKGLWLGEYYEDLRQRVKLREEQEEAAELQNGGALVRPEPTTTFEDLPIDALIVIARKLTVDEMRRMRLVSKYTLILVDAIKWDYLDWLDHDPFGPYGYFWQGVDIFLV